MRVQLLHALKVALIECQGAHGKIHLDGLWLKFRQNVKALARGAIRGGEVDLRAVVRAQNGLVGALGVGGQFLIVGNGQVRYQGRLSQLYPIHAGLIQLGQYLLICLDGIIQAVERGLGSALGLLGQGQQGNRADEVWAHGVACCAGFFHQLDNALWVRLKVLVIRNFRDDVVVVGIEPLSHL